MWSKNICMKGKWLEWCWLLNWFQFRFRFWFRFIYPFRFLFYFKFPSSFHNEREYLINDLLKALVLQLLPVWVQSSVQFRFKFRFQFCCSYYSLLYNADHKRRMTYGSSVVSGSRLVSVSVPYFTCNSKCEMKKRPIYPFCLNTCSYRV